MVDDLTDLRHVTGPFDLLVDYGVLDDLRPKNRDLYVQNVLPLAHPDTRYLLYTWEWPLRWWERTTFAAALEPGEVERRFGAYFEIEPLVRKTGLSGWPHGFAVYLMTRNGDGYPQTGTTRSTDR
jgi:hypothetical protein